MTFDIFELQFFTLYGILNLFKRNTTLAAYYPCKLMRDAETNGTTLTNETLTIKRQVWTDAPVREKISPLTLVEKELLEEVNSEVVMYFKSIPFVMDQKVLYLSTIRHYIFDSATLYDVNTVLNLRLVNRISHVNYFLFNTNRMLPMKGYYLGCFENQTQQKKRIKSLKPKFLGSISYVLFSFFHSLLPKIPGIRNLCLFATNGSIKCLTTNSVATLLLKNGFLLTDTSVIQGKTYFVAQKVKLCKKENLSISTLLYDYKHHSKIVKL